MIGQQQRYKRIAQYLPKQQRIRNVSIVAHVDHGKTTLADCLISSNGIIHRKQAGQLKLLDDRLDEQDRGITMKSSSICLMYQDHLINLIDSPGHLQFYTEVSAALRLTDSTLLVVDAVEGVSSQTFRVIQQLYHQKLPAILILNKIDKLITHCKMDPYEAYCHISQIIEQVNAILGSFITKQVGTLRSRSKSQDKTDESIDRLEQLFYFSAEKRNIIFGTALCNWGFSPETFAPLIANKLGVQPEKIIKYLWGDFYYYPKTKQFKQTPKNQNDKPFCVDLVLKPIWDIYENVWNKNVEKIQKIIQMLNLKISDQVKKNYNDQLIKEILSNWIPIDKVVLKKIIDVLPNPPQAQKFRLSYLLKLHLSENQTPKNIAKALQLCKNSSQVPFIAFISKMVNIPKKNINQRGLNELTGQGDIRTVGIGRIFSGTIKRGSKVVVIGNKKKKVIDENGESVQVPDISFVTIENLYIFNAQFPEGIQQAYAGNIVGFGNLQEHIFKSGTISSEENCISFTPVASQTKSILKVSVTTPQVQNNKKLIQGLKKLNKSDSSVDVYVEENGDIILNTCGQVHLQKCIVDLQQIYCRCPIKVSQPIVNFRQTIIWTNPTENKNEKIIHQFQKKQEEKQKKLNKQKFKLQKRNDAELDQQEKQKLKAIQEWDSHVEIYQSQDLTGEDTRFFFKNRNEETAELKQKYDYKNKEDKYKKVVDHKNKGKLHLKQKFTNLNLKTNIACCKTPNGIIEIKVKALGLQFDVAEFLEKNHKKMNELFGRNDKKKVKISIQQLRENRLQFMKEFTEKLKQFSVDPILRTMIFEKMVCFSSRVGTNLLLINNLQKSQSLFFKLENPSQPQQTGKCFHFAQQVQNILEDYKTTHSEVLNSIILGFDIACGAGPLCNQPLMGTIFIVQEINLCQKKEQKEEEEHKVKTTHSDQKNHHQEKTQIKQEMIEVPKEGQKKNMFTDIFGPLTGQIMSTIKQVCLQSFIGASPRLVQPMYLCELQTDHQYYGNVHNQLSKRRAKILQEDLHQVTNVFIIKAHLPIIQSFGIYLQLLDKTQGTVNAQLNFDTWKIFPQDPFYTPLTQEQIQENGLENVLPNLARQLLDKIRIKKGLQKTEKIVVAAQKQRNLKKD